MDRPPADASTDSAGSNAPRLGAAEVLLPAIQTLATSCRGLLHDRQLAAQADEVLAIAIQRLANFVADGARRGGQPAIQQSAHRFQPLMQLQQSVKLLVGTRGGSARKALEEACEAAV